MERELRGCAGGGGEMDLWDGVMKLKSGETMAVEEGKM